MDIGLCQSPSWEVNFLLVNLSWRAFFLLAGEHRWKLCVSPAGRIAHQSECNRWEFFFLQSDNGWNFSKPDFWPLSGGQHDISGRSRGTVELEWEGLAGLRNHAGHCEGEGLFLFLTFVSSDLNYERWKRSKQAGCCIPSTDMTRCRQNIARIANAVPVTLYSKVTK